VGPKTLSILVFIISFDVVSLLMPFFHIGKFVLLSFLLLIGCKSRQKENVSVTSPARPSIYDAWEARYQYDLSQRSMKAMHKGQVYGRNWSRDAKGKMNQFSYQSPSEEMGENLLPRYYAKIDQDRDSNWESAKQQRIEFLETYEELMKQDEEDSLIEIDLFDLEEEDNFDASGFIPQGLGFDNSKSSVDETPANPKEEGAGAEDLPFLPLP